MEGVEIILSLFYLELLLIFTESPNIIIDAQFVGKYILLSDYVNPQIFFATITITYSC